MSCASYIDRIASDNFNCLDNRIFKNRTIEPDRIYTQKADSMNQPPWKIYI
ncbi:hypothetical protein [Chamaesiphon polymorphus]|uniref:hypothetical protein n=1 Tax=Chamaesiphon polymorphus TaxID=2107691 RepID=UPI001C626C0C|nr:hypothetical protein [Chamaesiphon polymorphus]